MQEVITREQHMANISWQMKLTGHNVPLMDSAVRSIFSDYAEEVRIAQSAPALWICVVHKICNNKCLTFSNVIDMITV